MAALKSDRERFWSDSGFAPFRVLAEQAGAEQVALEPQRELDRRDLARRLAVLDVVALREPPVAGDQFGDRERGVGRDRWRRLAGGGVDIDVDYNAPGASVGTGGGGWRSLAG
jgi:hypothetical protein